MMEEYDETLTPQEKADILNYDIPENITEIEKRLKDGLLFAKKRRTLIALLLASALRTTFQNDSKEWGKWVRQFSSLGKNEHYQMASIGNMLLDLKAANKPLYNFGLKLASDKLMALTLLYNVKKNEHDIGRVINFCNGARSEVIERVERAELYRMIHLFLDPESKPEPGKQPLKQPELPGFDKMLDGVLRIETRELVGSVTDSGKAGLYINSGLRIFAAGLEYFKAQPKDRGILHLDSLELDLRNELQQIVTLKREAAQG